LLKGKQDLTAGRKGGNPADKVAGAHTGRMNSGIIFTEFLAGVA
jgi:hypothetical protein